MKKYFAALLCVLFFALCACGNSPQKAPDESGQTSQTPSEPQTPPETPPETKPAEPVPLTWGDRVYNKTYSDDALSTLPLLTMTITLPQVNGCNDINLYYDSVSERFAESAASYLNMARELLSTAGEYGFFTTFSIDASYQVARNDGVLFSVVRSVYQNTGGAHPNFVTVSENFCVETGSYLLFDDVFTVPRAEVQKLLTPYIEAQMKEREAGETFYFENARDDLWQVWDAKSFYFTADSLVLYWQTYDLAPFAAGLQDFSIPLSELSSVLNEKWIKN